MSTGLTKPPHALRSRIERRIARERFYPTWLSLLFNPNFISRRRLLRFIRKTASGISLGDVLDFGAGEMPYKDYLQYRSYVALDWATSSQRRAPAGIDVLYYDGTSIPMEDTRFDTVIATEVFEHLFNLDEALAEIHRVLRPDGHLLVTVPFAIHEHEAPFDFARYTTFGIGHVLQRHGFRVAAMERLGSYRSVLLQLINWSVWIKVRRRSRLAKALAVPVFALMNGLDRVLSSLSREDGSPAMYLNIGIVARKERHAGPSRDPQEREEASP